MKTNQLAKFNKIFLSLSLFSLSVACGQKPGTSQTDAILSPLSPEGQLTFVWAEESPKVQNHLCFYGIKTGSDEITALSFAPISEGEWTRTAFLRDTAEGFQNSLLRKEDAVLTPRVASVSGTILKSHNPVDSYLAVVDLQLFEEIKTIISDSSDKYELNENGQPIECDKQPSDPQLGMSAYKRSRQAFISGREGSEYEEYRHEQPTSGEKEGSFQTKDFWIGADWLKLGNLKQTIKDAAELSDLESHRLTFWASDYRLGWRAHLVSVRGTPEQIAKFERNLPEHVTVQTDFSSVEWL